MMATHYAKLASGAYGNFCAGCAHYAEPGRTSAMCLIARDAWNAQPALTRAHVASLIRRADNSCPQFTASKQERAA